MKKYMKETLKYYNENYKLYNSMWSNFEFDIPNIFLSYLEKGTYLGQIIKNELYLVFMKDGKYLPYENYL